MPKFTAMVHAGTDLDALEETLFSVRFANDILVIAENDDDKVISHRVSKSRGRTKTCIPGVSPGAYAMDAFYHWILVLRPGEILEPKTQEQLQAWQQSKNDDESSYAVCFKDAEGPHEFPRLINRKKINWTGELPPNAGCEALPEAA